MDHEGVHPPNPETDTPQTQRQAPPIQADTPLWADTPPGRHPPYGEERAVLILLEYILVFIHSQLIGRANTWLQSNPEYSIVTCETVVQYWARSHGYNPYRAIATRSKVQADVTVCMHVLRCVVMVLESLSLVDPRGHQGRAPPQHTLLGSISFIFMQFSGQNQGKDRFRSSMSSVTASFYIHFGFKEFFEVFAFVPCESSLKLHLY